MIVMMTGEAHFGTATSNITTIEQDISLEFTLTSPE